MVAADEMPLDSAFRFKFSTRMNTMPNFEGSENCTYTMRVPRSYFAPLAKSTKADGPCALEEICRRRQLWGTDVYTDDSDVIAAAVHSGWLRGEYGDSNKDLHELLDNESEGEEEAKTSSSLTEKPRRPIKVPREHDVHITVLICPPLESYASTTQHHILSREWNRTHDGASYMIHRIDFVDEGLTTRYAERGIAARKQRIAFEEARRVEAAAGLLMFANGVSGAVRVGA